MSPARLAHMRAATERFMRDRCTISRDVAVAAHGAPGKPDYRPVPPGDPVICAISAVARPGEQEVALQLQGIKTYTLSVPVGTDLMRGDHVTIGGAIYGVVGVDDVSAYSASLDALIRAVGATS